MILRPPSGVSEWEEYYRLRWTCLREPWGQPHGSERDDHERDAHHLVAEQDGEVVAVGRIHPLGDHCWRIRYMAVREGSRGQGIGGALLEALLDHARAAGARRVVLNSREAVAGFYQRAGFRVLGRAPLLFGEIPHLRMELDLE
jgi:predicted GNAT family N-acyltransferase